MKYEFGENYFIGILIGFSVLCVGIVLGFSEIVEVGFVLAVLGAITSIGLGLYWSYIEYKKGR